MRTEKEIRQDLPLVCFTAELVGDRLALVRLRRTGNKEIMPKNEMAEYLRAAHCKDVDEFISLYNYEGKVSPGQYKAMQWRCDGDLIPLCDPQNYDSVGVYLGDVAKSPEREAPFKLTDIPEFNEGCALLTSKGMDLFMFMVKTRGEYYITTRSYAENFDVWKELNTGDMQKLHALGFSITSKDIFFDASIRTRRKSAVK